MRKSRYEKAVTMSKEDMAKFLCQFTEILLYESGVDDFCMYCPAVKYCDKKSGKGFIEWLDE